ncbi:hypothetical protein K3495_g1444 [Podosphaera aphanis]|nr:hypothetical protein K3495_g1444 [Podosphaera aphanis]
MLFKTWVNRASIAHDANDTKGLPYHASAPTKPPNRKLFPTSGNGVNGFSDKTSKLGMRLRQAPPTSHFTTSGDAGRLVDTFKTNNSSAISSQDLSHGAPAAQVIEIKQKCEDSSPDAPSDLSSTSKESGLPSTQRPFSIDIFDAQAAVRKLFFTELFEARTTLLSTREVSQDTVCMRVPSSYGENVADRNIIAVQEEINIRKSEESMMSEKSKPSLDRETHDDTLEIDPMECIVDKVEASVEEVPRHQEKPDDSPKAQLFRQKASSFSHNVRSLLDRTEFDRRHPKTAGSSNPNFPNLFPIPRENRSRSHSKTSISSSMKKQYVDLKDFKIRKVWPTRSSSLIPTSVETSRQTRLPSNIAPIVQNDDISLGLTQITETKNDKIIENTLPDQKNLKNTNAPTINVVGGDTQLHISGTGAVTEQLPESSAYFNQLQRERSSESLPDNKLMPKRTQGALSNRVLSLKRSRSSIKELSPESPQSPPTGSLERNLKPKYEVNDAFEPSLAAIPYDEYPHLHMQTNEPLTTKYTPNLRDLVDDEAADAPIIPLFCNHEITKRHTLNFPRNLNIASKVSSKNCVKRRTLSRKKSYFSDGKEAAYDDSMKWIHIIRSNGVPSIRSISPLPELYSDGEDSSDPEDKSPAADGEDLLFRLHGYGANGALPGLQVRGFSFPMPQS